MVKHLNKGRQQFGSPRIYVDFPQWLREIGDFELPFFDDWTANTFMDWHEYENPDKAKKEALGLLNLNPAHTKVFNVTGLTQPFSWGDIYYESGGKYSRLAPPIPIFPNYCAFLNHNFNKANVRLYFRGGDEILSFQGDEGNYLETTEIVNHHNGVERYNGFTILGLEETDGYDALNIRISSNQYGENTGGHGGDSNYNYPVKLGSISYGRYYDFPKNADISVKTSLKYKGAKRYKSINGSTLSNSLSEPKMWGDLPAWSLSEMYRDATGKLVHPLESEPSLEIAPHYEAGMPYHIGATSTQFSQPWKNTADEVLRTWSVTFSFMSDKEIFGVNQSSSIVNADAFGESMEGYQAGTDYYAWYFNETISTGESFYHEVINRTIGGKNSFIFTPDSNNTNPDNFFICKFDMDTFSVTQVAPSLYNMSIDIKELY